MSSAAPAATAPADQESAEHPPLDRGALASWPSRVGAAEVALLTLAIAGDVLDHLPISVILAGALGAGLLIGLLPPVDRLFRSVTGFVIGSIAGGVLLGSLLMSNAVFGTSHELLIAVPIVALVPIGADWRRAARLRTWVLVSGLAVIGVLGMSVDTFDGVPSGRARLAAIAWLAITLASLRLLNHDLATAVPRPAPASGGEARGPGRKPIDLVVFAVASLLVLGYLNALASSLDCGLHHATCAERAAQERDQTTVVSQPNNIPTTAPRPTIFEEPDKSTDEGPPIYLLIGALVAVAVVVLAIAVWWGRRRRRYRGGGLLLGPGGFVGRSNPWAEEMAQGLGALGVRYGRPRTRAEPLAAYAEVLGEEAVDDRRLAGVGSVVSSAFFGPAEPPAEQCAWAQAVLTEIAERPVPAPDPRVSS